MLYRLLLSAVLISPSVLAAQAPQQQATTSGQAVHATNPCDLKGDTIDPAMRLLHVHRIFVDSFGEDPISKQVQGMVINSLSESKRFIVTENKAKADATLKGVGLEKTSQEFHSVSEGTGVASAGGAHHGSVNGSFVNGTGTVSGSSSGGFAAHAARIDDSVASTETIDHARIAVRLIDTDGDVIWTSTQESKGAKYKGASADVADKIAKQLLHDIEKLQKGSASAPLTSEPK